MNINITYDSSVADAPKGFKAAVVAAVQFFEQTFSANITVNITFGWGEVAGEPLTPSALAQSAITVIIPEPGTSGSASPVSPAIIDAINELHKTKPVLMEENGLVPFALARLHGEAPTYNSIQDGYVGLNSAASYTFDPNNRAVANKYDAIGVLEHEISEVLGRVSTDGIYQYGEGPPFPRVYDDLDYYRYTSPGVHALLPGAGYFSLNGDQFLLPFNDPANGGDPGDWAPSVHGDSFEAFAETGVRLSVSTVDVRVMELLGYAVSFTAPTPNGVPVSPQKVSANLQIASGQTLSFDGPRALMLSSPAAVDNFGAIVDSGVRSLIDVIGVASTESSHSAFTNEAGAVLSVTGVDVTDDAVGVYGSLTIVNAGLIRVVSQQADAWGILGNSFSNLSTGTLSVQALDHATGVDFSWFGTAQAISNAGTITATGLHAIGVTGMTDVTNSGTIEATGVGDGATSAAVFIEATGIRHVGTYTNSGLIEGQYSILVDPLYAESNTSADSVINNSGTLHGIVQLSELNSTITNTGSIVGAINFGNGNSVYNGVGGTQSGGIFLGYGTNTVTLGNDGEAVVGGNGTDAITGGTGNDFIEIALGSNTIDGGAGFNTLSFADAPMAVTVNLANGTASTNGADTISNIQEVIGSGYGNTMIAGSSAVTFIGGEGSDVLQGGAGNDTLVAGTGGASLTGGGGSDTFVYSSGGKSVVINDFGVNGDQDTLQIYGYSAASSVVQHGNDTLITLSAGDTVLLKNVSAASLTGGKLVYHAAAWQAPQVPVSPPVFGTTTLHFSYDLKVLANETIDEAGQNIGLSDEFNSNDHLFPLDNFGTILVSVASGDVVGVASNSTGGLGSDLVNEAGATFAVTDTDPLGAAMGINFDFSSFSNASSFTVGAQGDAYGLYFFGGAPITNMATGTIRVTSANGNATGILAHNGDDGFLKRVIENDGLVHATGHLTAYGVLADRADLPTALINKGTILADGTDAGTRTVGVLAGSGSVITNSGTITGQTAIQGVSDAETTPSFFSVTNTGTLNGNIVLASASATIRNSGAIHGALTFGNGDSHYIGSTGTLTGPITLGFGRNTVTLGKDGGVVFGGGGTDNIKGGAGNDFVEIGRGNNTLAGSGGVNTLSFADADQAVMADLQKGTATASGSDTFNHFQIVIGSTFDDTLLAAKAGSTLIAGSGYDTLQGRAGNDTFVAGAGGDKVTGSGGNDTIIYSKGDHKLVVTDFCAHGSHDVLHIDGFASADSIKQVGHNTVIKLSDGGNITLWNVQASSLNASNLIFDSHPYQGPAVPDGPPVFLTDVRPIAIDYANDDGVTVYKGETMHLVSHTSDIQQNENIGIFDIRFSTASTIVSVLDNAGTLEMVTNDSVRFVGIVETGAFGAKTLVNEAQAVFSIVDTAGDAVGIDGESPVLGAVTFTNSGTLTLEGSGEAVGVVECYLTNSAGAVISATSDTADAIALDYMYSFVNDGTITAHGATAAAGVSSIDFSGGGPFTNNGTITASTSDPDGVSFGIILSDGFNTDGALAIINTGTITADFAIMNVEVDPETGLQGYMPLAITNSGTLNGAVDMGGSQSLLINSGAVNGDITFRTVQYGYQFPPEFGASPPTLTNSGTITGDIFLNGSTATVTNTGTIISNDIELGTGSTFISTGGAVEIGSGLSALVGAIRVASDGTFEGAAAVQADLSVAAGATVKAIGGTLSIDGKITGLGQVVIGSGSTLDVSGSISSGVAFADGTGTLELHAPGSETGQISGLQVGDKIDLVGIHASTATVNSGVLTVTDSIGDTFTFHVSGNLAGNSFAIVDDGAGGSDIVLGTQSGQSHPSAEHSTDSFHYLEIWQLLAEHFFGRAFFHHADHLA